jgi:glycosyltransferase involved in cell wall biosynthesis
MNIFVVATTLQAGGGITIYKQFLSHLSEHIGQNKYWIFVNPVLPQLAIEGVKYISFPLQSKIKRTLFEDKLLKAEITKLKVNPDVVVSLQNRGYKCFNTCKQLVYFHQSLPLYPGSYNPFKRSERYLFNYKYIFPRLVKRTWVKNTQFIVQTPVVKKRFVSYFDIPMEHVHVCFPDIEKIDIAQGKIHDWGDKCFHFLCVSACAKYQNGITLIKAIELLYKKNPDLASKIRIHITIAPHRAPVMYELVQRYGVGDNFIFEGVIKHNLLMNYYKSISALLFPSSIETVGLPLLEAAAFGKPIIVADVDYARYVLNGYEGVIYSNIKDYNAWAEAIKDACNNKNRLRPLMQKRESEWFTVFKLIQE